MIVYLSIFLFAYFFILFFFFFLYKHFYSPIEFKTTVSPNGHLSWEWIRFTGHEKWFLALFGSIYILPYLFSKNGKFSDLYIAFISFVILYMLYKKDNTYGSLWCWVFNLAMIKYVIDILIIMPFYEYNGLC